MSQTLYKNLLSSFIIFNILVTCYMGLSVYRHPWLCQGEWQAHQCGEHKTLAETLLPWPSSQSWKKSKGSDFRGGMKPKLHLSRALWPGHLTSLTSSHESGRY